MPPEAPSKNVEAVRAPGEVKLLCVYGRYVEYRYIADDGFGGCYRHLHHK